MSPLGLALSALLAAGASPLTLEQALELADRQNPELAAARAAAAAQEADAQGAARRERWPRLALSADVFRTDNPAAVFAARLNRAEFGAADFEIGRLNDPAAASHLTTALSLELPLDVSGQGRASAQAARALSTGADADASEARAAVRLGVIRAYWSAALARHAQDATARALAAARTREADLVARVTEGTSLTADLLRIRARRRQREADLAQREEERHAADAALVRALGAPAGVAYELAEAVHPPAPPEPLEGWLRRAEAGRGALRSAAARVEAARWAVRAESRSARPEVAFQGRLQDDRWTEGAGSATAGVSVRWAAFDATRGRRVAAAQARALAAEHAARAAGDQVRMEVEAAWWRVRTALDRYQAALGGAEEGREALRVVRERRQAGLATLTDELETEAASLAAELQEMAASVDAAVADAALRRAAGEAR